MSRLPTNLLREAAVDIKVNAAPPRPTWDDYCDRCYAAADAARRAEQRVAMGRRPA